MSISDAISVGSTIYGILSPPIFRQCGYILFCKSHASDLQDEIDKLKDAAARVQHSVDESRSAGEFIHEDVMTWLRNANQCMESGNIILKTNKVGRVLRFVPDPKACHKLGRNAKKAIPDFQKLLSEGQNIDNVSYHRVEEQSLIVGASTSSKRNYVQLKSRDAVFKFVMEALNDDKINAIGVYGMGGVGKTTLLKEVEKGAKESKKFDGVVSVFVSQTPNLTAICAEIDYRLKRLGYDESRKTVLILFDDIWKPLDLKDLGVPESNNKLKVKLVMTSRKRQLLANEMSCQRTFSVGVLGTNEAWQFFAELVSSEVEDLKGKPALVAFLKKCAGLPVSIEALATLWKKKKMDSTSGDLSEDELKNAKESPDGFASLELSYSSLEDGDEENQAKLVFRTIGLLNTPKVPVLTLIKYMLGLGLFRSSTNSYNIVERARMEITRSLRTLQESSLLLESEDSDHVKIHDVVRDVAVGIASREDRALIFDPLKGVKEWSMEKLKECKAVSLTSSVVLKLPEGWNSPDLDIFVLEAESEQGDHHVELPDPFFNGMVKLSVIHFKNAQFTSLPSSINPDDLQNLTTLCLDNCCLEDIAVIGKLVTLQVLSLTGSDLAKLPEEIGELTNLRMLDLSKCSMLVFIKPGILERLTQLEELYLRESFDKWGIKGDGGKMNASLEELNSMPRLRTLEVRIPDTSKLPQNLPLGDLVQSKVLMGESWDWSGEYNESRTLKLEVKWDSIINEEWFQSALQKTQDLHLEGLNGTIESFHELCSDGFEELKHLHLQNSSSIKCVIWSTEWLECSAFTVLESMVLEKMGSLEKICDGRISLSSFSKLKVVRVQECSKLRSIFNLSLLKNLTELEEIEIIDCDMLRQIVIAEQVDAADDDDDATGEEQQNVGMNGCSNILFGRPTKRLTTDVEEGATAADNEIVMLLGNLRNLTLRNLPEITSFFTAEQVDDDGGGGGGATGEEQQSGGGAGGGAGATEEEQQSGGGATGEEQQSGGGGATGEEQQSVGMIGCSNIFFGHGAGEIRPWRRKITPFFTAEGGPSDQTMETSVAPVPVFFNDQKVSKPPKYKAIQSTTRLRLDKLQRVELTDCKNVVHFTNSQVLLKLVNLESLTIEGCASLEDIFDLKGIETQTGNVEILPKLYELKLRDLPKLEHIWKNNLRQIKGCRKLRTVEIYKCNNLLYFSSSFMCEVMENLTEINVGYCEKIETIFREEEGQQSNASSIKAQLASLKILAISYCENLKTFSTGFRCCGKKAVADASCNLVHTSNSFFNEKVFLPNLETLLLTSPGEFEKLWCGEIPPGHESSYCKLEYLHVVGCGSLRSVIPASMIERLDNLKQLWVSWCSKLEVVFDMDGGWKTKKKLKALMLPQLQQVRLEYLNSLTHVMERGSDDEIVVGFPSLNRLKVACCNKLINLIPTTTATTLIELKSIDIICCQKLQEVIGGEVSERYKRNAITFPHLTSLTLDRLDSLTCFSSESPRLDFTRLKILKIEFCKSLKKLIQPRSDGRLGSEDEKDQANTTTQALFSEKIQLPNLEELYVADCEVLEELWNEAPTTSSLCKLKLLEVSGCSSLENVIPSFMVDRMQNLERLCISRCDSLQDIFKTTSSTKQIQSSHDRIIVFGKLTFLQLEDKIELSNLRSGTYTLEIPTLKKLVLNRTDGAAVEAIMEKVCLPNLEELEVSSLEITEVWHSEPYVGSFSKLKRLQVKSCGELVKIISLFMLKRLQNLEMLEVEKCKNLKIVCELEWQVDDGQDSESPFQNLASIHVLENDSDCKIVQLPQLTYLRLRDLPEFDHLFQVLQGQYTLELSSLKKFLLIEAGDKEAVIQKVTFPENLEIQLSEEGSNFFGTNTSVMTDIAKALQQTNQVIIGLLGEMDFNFCDQIKEEAANPLFDEVATFNDIVTTPRDIQDVLGGWLGIVYGEGDVQGRAQRLRKALLNYIRNRSLLLIFLTCNDYFDDGTIEHGGTTWIPVDGFDPKHFKVILFSKKEERLLKIGAQVIIPFGDPYLIESRWEIFIPELDDDSQQEKKLPAVLDDTNTTEHDNIRSFLGPDTILCNNCMKALYSHQGNNLIIGMLGSFSSETDEDNMLINSVGELIGNDDYEIVDADDNEVDTIQANLKTALGITSSSSSEITDAQCIRQSLLSNQQKRLLLLLENLNQELDLEAVGIPPIDELDPRFFKILLISEKKQVMQKMGAQQIFDFKSSSESSNRHYYGFYRIVDGYVHTLELRKLDDECGSTDLAKLLANKLKGQGMHAWANAYRRLKDSPFEYEERRKVIASL